MAKPTANITVEFDPEVMELLRGLAGRSARRPAIGAAMKCDWGSCQADPTHSITACYPLNADDDHPHPMYRAYPAPMYRACRTHLATLMQHDSLNAGATPGYLVRVLP